MEDLQTKIPDLLYDIKTVHHEKLETVFTWMKECGADLWHTVETSAWRANFNLTVKHENEYCEDGWARDDPNFEHYYIFSWAEIMVTVPINSLQFFLQMCDQYKYWSDYRWDDYVAIKDKMEPMKERIACMKADGIFLDTDTTNQFTMEKRIHFSDCQHESCEVRLRWEIYHTFNER